LSVFTITKGYDLPLEGEASSEIGEAKQAELISVQPKDFPFHKFRVLVQEGDEVKVGTPLLASKLDESLLFTSTAAGTVEAVRRGERRALLGIDIRVSGTEDAIDFGSVQNVPAASKEDLVQKLKKGGMWNFLRQRPFSKIAEPDSKPKAVFVNAMSTAPLAPKQEILCQGREKELQAGIDALKVLSGVSVYFITAAENASSFSVQGTENHSFQGPHPAGLVSTHISRISPLNHGENIWYINAYQASLLGEFLLRGKVPTHCLVALTGAEAPERRYYKMLRNSRLASLVADSAENRVISGDVLTGSTAGATGFLSFYDNQVTVIPEGGKRHFIGSDKHWAGPGFSNFSLHNLFLSKLLGKKKWNLDTSVNGGERAIIQPDIYEKYSPLDIYITFLVKACIAKDIERMEQLGILEIDSEDVALCTFACPSKVEVSEIIRQGLELVEREG
jgi:Na+-transporting NADH:ubiquinone oxidoreductase subunit A